MASSALVSGGNSLDASSADARSPPVCNLDPSGSKPSSINSYGGGGVGSRISGVPDLTRAQPGPGSTGTGTGTGTATDTPSPCSPPELVEGTRRPRSNTPGSVDAPATASKKRRTGPGSRGVANLTPEQLARKRANDREAQRAIRERHRLRTEQYEQEIRELKSKQPYQELQGVLRQKEAVEAELAEVKRCMAAIMAMVQPILARPAGAVGGGASVVDQSPPYRAPSQPPAATIPSESTPTSATSPVSVGTHGSWQYGLSPVVPSVGVEGQSQPSAEMGQLRQQRHDLAHGLDFGPEKLGLDFLLDPNQKIARIQSGVNGAQDSPQYRHVPMKHDWAAACTPPATYTQTSVSTPPATYTHTAMYSSQPSASAGMPSASYPIKPNSTATITTTITTDVPFCTRVPKTVSPTCPLDSVLLDFLAERRQRIAEGLSQPEILGPRYPSVSSLLNPAVSVYSHPISKVFTDILTRFPSLTHLPERVAVLYINFVNMRWQVFPTRENYLRLPEWLRPLPVQTEKEHAAWLDFVPFPKLRQMLVGEYEPGEFSFDEFFLPYTETLSVNWPYDDAYVLLANPKGDELMINPVFEQHLSMLKNWTVGEAFHRAFPQLAGTYNLKIGS